MVDMEIPNANVETASKPISSEKPPGSDEDKLEKVSVEGSLDFDEWTFLISDIENSFPDDIDKLSVVYDSFLAKFPLCYGYWRKYADHKKRLCTVDKVVEVFERAVQAATYSVGLWVDYCVFGVSVFEDPNDVRRLFKRGISFVGKDYLCHKLWDKYIDFEFSQQQWNLLALIYVQTLRFPTKKLHQFYDSFKKLGTIWKEEIESQRDGTMELQSELEEVIEVSAHYTDNEISDIIQPLLDPSTGFMGSKALQKYLSIGERFYRDACQLDEKIHCFESRISRSYFQVKPLDKSQLENWHQYLNFVEVHGDFDWAVKLYERCLIPCANYPEFWMRYVDFMENNGGREIANFALARATQTFLKQVAVIHLFDARFKEQIGELSAAHAAFLQCETESDSGFVENVIMKANMEKRLGNFVAASNTYKEALEVASSKKNLKILPALYIHFSQLIYVMTTNVDAARDILIDGIKAVPHCNLLLEELIKFVMIHGGAQQVEMVDSIIAKEISPSPDASHTLVVRDLVDISSLYLQFVDLCGTIHDIRKAWARHFKLFPQSLMTMYKHPLLGTGPSNIIMEGKNETHITPSQQPPGACDINDAVHLPLWYKNLPLREAEDTQSNDFFADKLSDQKSQLPENHDFLSDQVTIDLLQSRETESSSHEQVQQVSLEALKQSMVDATKPNMSSLAPVDQVADEIKTLQTSQDVKENDVRHENDYESEEHLKPFTLERLPLDSEGDKNICSIHVESDKWEASQEASMSNGSMLRNGQNTMEVHFLSSPRCARASDAIEIQTCTLSPSTASPQIGITEAFHRQRSSMQSGRNWHRRNNVDKVYRDSKSSFRGNSRKKFSQQYHDSQEKQYPRANSGTQTPASQVYPNQHVSLEKPLGPQGSQELTHQPASLIHANQTVPPTSSMTNMQEHNFSLTSMGQMPSQGVSYFQGQMLQYQLQSNEQHGPVQNNQAYMQMWQYYYYQQQQQQQVLLLQQQQQSQVQQQQQSQVQQQLQLQPHYVQQEEVKQQQASSQHPELEQLQQQDQQLQFQQKQQLLQQHQYTQLQLQQQQQLLQQQQQQLLQQQQQQLLQQQQQQLLQQQQQTYQQNLLYMQQQELQLQYPQNQQLQEQQLVQQQLNPQSMLQQEQQERSQQPRQPEEEQRQVEQQTSKLQIQSWGNNCKEGQGVTMLHGTSGSGCVESAASPNPQQHSPQNE